MFIAYLEVNYVKTVIEKGWEGGIENTMFVILTPHGEQYNVI